MSTCASVTKDFLVFLEAHDTCPQRLRLRMMEDKNLDGLLWQIERQLADSDGAFRTTSRLTLPLESANCRVFVADPRDSALVPFANATFDILRTTDKIVVCPHHAAAEANALAAASNGTLPSSDCERTKRTMQLALSTMARALATTRDPSVVDWANAVAAEVGRCAADGRDVDGDVLSSFQAALSCPPAVQN